jgi:hypothetical protein
VLAEHEGRSYRSRMQEEGYQTRRELYLVRSRSIKAQGERSMLLDYLDCVLSILTCWSQLLPSPSASDRADFKLAIHHDHDHHPAASHSNLLHVFGISTVSLVREKRLSNSMLITKTESSITKFSPIPNPNLPSLLPPGSFPYTPSNCCLLARSADLNTKPGTKNPQLIKQPRPKYLEYPAIQTSQVVSYPSNPVSQYSGKPVLR